MLMALALGCVCASPAGANPDESDADSGAAENVTGVAQTPATDAAQTPATEDETKPSTGPADRAPIVFVPRDAGAPVTRVGGATRGFNTQTLPSIDALVPEQIGYTLVGQPSLYWHLSKDTDTRVDFTLITQQATAPLIEITLDAPMSGGVHRINLADLGITLDPGVTYLWYVSLVPDPQRRSQDRVVGGAIERLTSEKIAAKVAAATDDERAAVLAREGIWYDAITRLSEAVSAGSPTALHERAELLEQVGLKRAAIADRGGR
jgi:hypothetical protein